MRHDWLYFAESASEDADCDCDQLVPELTDSTLGRRLGAVGRSRTARDETGSASSNIHGQLSDTCGLGPERHADSDGEEAHTLRACRSFNPFRGAFAEGGGPRADSRALAPSRYAGNCRRTR